MTTKKPHHHRTDRQQDAVLEDTFPASDPPANSGITGAEQPHGPSHTREDSERPTGTPTSDRHAAETAHHWEHQATHAQSPGSDKKHS